MAWALPTRKVAMKTKTKICCALFGILWLSVYFSLARAYEEIVVSNGATIRGTVKVEGKIPKLPPLQITKYKEICKDVPNESPWSLWNRQDPLRGKEKQNPPHSGTVLAVRALEKGSRANLTANCKRFQTRHRSRDISSWFLPVPFFRGAL